MKGRRAAEKRIRAGCLAFQKARSTKTFVGLYKAVEARLDPDGGPYVTVCEEHNHLVNHKTLALARSHLSHPENWCDVCSGDVEENG